MTEHMATELITGVNHFQSLIDKPIKLEISLNQELLEIFTAWVQNRKCQNWGLFFLIYPTPAFKTDIILITKYLNLNWNIVKSYIFFPKKWLILNENFQNCFGFRRMLCAYFNPILYHFTIWCTFGQLIGFYLKINLCKFVYHWILTWIVYSF